MPLTSKILNLEDFYFSPHGTGPSSPKSTIKIFPVNFGRDTQCQKSLDIVYFHIKLSKQLRRKMGHGKTESTKEEIQAIHIFHSVISIENVVL